MTYMAYICPMWHIYIHICHICDTYIYIYVKYMTHIWHIYDISYITHGWPIHDQYDPWVKNANLCKCKDGGRHLGICKNLHFWPMGIWYTVSIARRWMNSEIQDGGNQNRKLKCLFNGMSQWHDFNASPIICAYAFLACDTADIARRWRLIIEIQDGGLRTGS